MKKRLFLFLLFIFSTVPIFSEIDISTVDINLTVTKAPIPYSITLLYIKDSNNFTDFTNSENLNIDGLDLINGGETKPIRVVLSSGNLGYEQTFTTTFTANPFVMTSGNKRYEAGNDIKVISKKNNLEKYSYTTILPIGKNEEQILAEIIYKWGANSNLPAGTFISTNRLSITVE